MVTNEENMMTGISSKDWLGIDLGTFNCSAAVRLRNGKVVLIKDSSGGNSNDSDHSYLADDEGVKAFPSFISFNAKGEVELDAIGLKSKERLGSKPEHVVFGIKRLLGKTFNQLKDDGELERFPYRIRPDRKTGQCTAVIADRSYTIQELCTVILTNIKQIAQHQVGLKLDNVVISVPAFWDSLKASVVIEAARSAGFLQIKTISEPVAAALAYNLDRFSKPKKTVIFDLGHGTLDLTSGWLKANPKMQGKIEFTVEKITGDSELGGIDIDDRIVTWILEQTNLSELSVAEAAALRRIVEMAKIYLSENIEFSYQFCIKGMEYAFVLTQNDIKRLCEGREGEKNLLNEMRYQLVAVLDGSGWSAREVDSLLLIGGPTKMPCILEMLKICFNNNIQVSNQLDSFLYGHEVVDRMTSVALGAALSVADRSIADKIPMGWGIETVNVNDTTIEYVPDILIPRDSVYPSTKFKPHMVKFSNMDGLYQFKLIQQVPVSAVEQLGYEYQFAGLLKYSVQDPQSSEVMIRMELNESRELIISISEIYSGETITFTGVAQCSNVPLNYPIVTDRHLDSIRNEFQRVEPSVKIITCFMAWASETNRYIEKSLKDNDADDMRVIRSVEELYDELKVENPLISYHLVYSRINSNLWNANSLGVISRLEYNEFTNKLKGFESQLFRVEHITEES